MPVHGAGALLGELVDYVGYCRIVLLGVAVGCYADRHVLELSVVDQSVILAVNLTLDVCIPTLLY